MNLDTDLKRALRRQSPPAGFAERVMQRARRGGGGPAPPEPGGGENPRRSTLAAAASLMLAAVLGGYALHQRHEREGERARDQVLRAMSIASEKVAYAQQQVREIGSH